MFDGGHAGTGLSIAEGLAEARDLRHGLERIAVVVGDAALMSGLSLEALNDIGQRQTQMLIVRQRQRDVDQPDGRRVLASTCRQIKLSSAWRQSKSAYDRTVERVPVVGPHGPRAVEAAARSRSCSSPSPGQLFEDLGITYIGVVPGHDLRALLETLGRGAGAAGPDDRPRPDPEGPRLPAGRGRPGRLPRGGPAADGAAAQRARTAPSMPTESMADDAAPPTRGLAAPKKHPNYTAVFAAELIELARTDRRIVGITAGMPTGTGHVQVPGRRSRTGSSTSGSPSSTR